VSELTSCRAFVWVWLKLGGERAAAGAHSLGTHPLSLQIPPPRYFDFTPSLAQYVADASLIISHAGSGSIFESLTAGKTLIVVPNPLLMDNHQTELGNHLKALGVLVGGGGGGCGGGVELKGSCLLVCGWGFQALPLQPLLHRLSSSLVTTRSVQPPQEVSDARELAAAVTKLDGGALKPFVRGDASGIVAAIDALTGRVATAAVH
jgi:hypothetical protein